jgi:hypothetical protein
MLCPHCDKEALETDALCRFCGSSLSPALIRPPSTNGASIEALEETPQRSRNATASVVLGLLSVTALVGLFAAIAGDGCKSFLRGLVFTGFLAGLVGVIYGHRAKASIRRSGGRLPGKGKAIAGLVLGYLGLAAMLFIVGISVFMVLFVENSRLAANQSAALGSLQRINTAATIYAGAYGGFPPTLASLGPAKADAPNGSAVLSKEAAGLLDENLASGLKSNYRFSYIPGPTDGTGKIRTYAVHADPFEPGLSGIMDYYTDQTCIIRMEKGKEANQGSAPFSN